MSGMISADMPSSIPRDESDRSALRKLLRERRTALGAGERIAAATALVEHLEANSGIPHRRERRRLLGRRRRVAARRRSSAGCARADSVITCRSSTTTSACGSRHGDREWTIATNRYGIPGAVATPEDAISRRTRWTSCSCRCSASIAAAIASASAAATTIAASRSCASWRGRRNHCWSASVTLCRSSSTSSRATWDVTLDYVATERELIDCTIAEP